jgi:hypothetical protein
LSVAEKVRKLAALAASENEHEANAAARQACRLIREGKVRLSEIEIEPERAAGGSGARGRSQRAQPGWNPWDAWAPVARPRRKPMPRGPFARKRCPLGQSCFVCSETIDPDDAFSCLDGFVHGDCVPKDQRP